LGTDGGDYNIPLLSQACAALLLTRPSTSVEEEEEKSSTSNQKLEKLQQKIEKITTVEKNRILYMKRRHP
jgi:hypothetical protein